MSGCERLRRLKYHGWPNLPRHTQHRSAAVPGTAAGKVNFFDADILADCWLRELNPRPPPKKKQLEKINHWKQKEIFFLSL